MRLRWYGLNQYGFKIEDEVVTFSVYMDDLRLYAKTDNVQEGFL